MAPGNPLGAEAIFDGGNPRTFTAKAREAVSGGDLLMVSGATAVVGSGASSYVAGDIEVALSDDQQRFNGIALATVSSGNFVAVATRGSYLLKCGGSCLPGQIVETIGDEVAVQSLSSGAVPGGLHTGIMAAKPIGRSQTAGASGGFALVDLSA